MNFPEGLEGERLPCTILYSTLLPILSFTSLRCFDASSSLGNQALEEVRSCGDATSKCEDEITSEVFLFHGRSDLRSETAVVSMYSAVAFEAVSEDAKGPTSFIVKTCDLSRHFFSIKPQKSFAPSSKARSP